MRSIGELKVRRTICDGIIRELMKMDDPRAPEALEHYRAQLTKLDAELTEAERAERARLGIPEPEPVVVGLKSARLFGDAQRSK